MTEATSRSCPTVQCPSDYLLSACPRTEALVKRRMPVDRHDVLSGDLAGNR
mgnify:CR=1 FL=1